MKMRLLLFAALLCFSIPGLKAQDKPVFPSFVGKGVFLGITAPLRDLPALTPVEIELMKEKAFKKAAKKVYEPRLYPYAETALPKGPDEAWQKSMGKSLTATNAPIVNFEGQTTSSYPPDCNGTAGPNHYMQTVNTTYAIYNKTGTKLAGPTALNTLFTGVPGATENDGDPIVLYDEQADRWLVAEFTFGHANDYMLVAVSTTNDPTGTWYKYSFDVTNQPDYPKFGIWQDGYYLGINNSSGKDTYVFEREKMLQGLPAQMVGFDNPWRPGTGFLCVPPLDNDGAFAPAGDPGMFIAFNDDGVNTGTDQLWLYALAVNWTTPAASTFTRTQQLDVTAFDSEFTSAWDDITQPNSQKLDGVPQVIMNVPQYRNFGSYQTIVCCHTVDVDATNHAGVRWYELRKTLPATTWTVRQQGTYAPDANSRWMGSIMLNGSGKLGLGYSISSSTIFPGIRYCGQSASAYAGATGVLDIAEQVIHNGTVAQTSYNRWGDYSLLSVDPTDDQTFWFTSEYVKTGGSTKGSKIASFKFGNDPTVNTLAATVVTGISATINGTVNPNGLETSYYFEWGTTTGYGNTSTTTAAGAGTETIAVSENLTGLTGGTTYHFRLVASNSDGISNGGDLVFTPGAASVTTAAVSAITLVSASAGGDVVSDGGSAITAKGVCWGITANPSLSGNFTTDGSGLGAFTSLLTGLSSNTNYHVRAYATNSSGTFYGDDVQFTTLCGIYTLPFSESFATTTIPNCWSQVDHQGNGQVWLFGTMTGPILTGNYAYLDSDGYGSGTSQNADLLTPTLDLTGYSTVTLQFKHYFKSYSGSSGSLSYSINNGTTWTQIQQFTTTSATNPATFNQVIAAVANQPLVKFKWNYTGTYGYSWSIDNVAITGVSTGILVSPANQAVTATAGTTPFGVTTAVAWTATSNAEWCTVTPSGTGNGTITATYTANILPVQRIASITATGTGFAPVVVTVTQAAAPATLAVTPAYQNIVAEAGSTSFNVTSNTSWNVISSQSWCSVTASGTGDGTISVTCAENLLVTSRTANISVTAGGLTPIVVTVTQAGALPTLAITPASYTVPAIANIAQFTVESNTDWSVTSDQNWCEVFPTGTGTAYLLATSSENLLVTARVANITVTVAGLEPIIVVVTQEGALPTLAVTPSNHDVTVAAGTTAFDVTSNTDWTVASDQTWCVAGLSGTGNGPLTISYDENLTVLPRVANITITVSGLTPVIVTISQEGAAPLLSLSPANHDVSEFSGSVEYVVTSNTDWTATSDSAWCVVTGTAAGSGNGTIVANYPINPYHNQRIAIISVNVAGLSAQTVTLTQSTSTLSVPESAANGIRLFPNPAKGLFTLVVEKSRYPMMEVSIINPAGVKILSRKCKGESEYHFDLSTMPQGCYFVKIKTATEVLTRELIIIK